MIEPLPNCFSIVESASSSAFVFSDSLPLPPEWEAVLFDFSELPRSANCDMPTFFAWVAYERFSEGFNVHFNRALSLPRGNPGV